MICFSAHDFLYTLSLCWPLTAVVPSFFSFSSKVFAENSASCDRRAVRCVCVCVVRGDAKERESDVYACQLSKAGLTYEHTARHKKTVENRNTGKKVDE